MLLRYLFSFLCFVFTYVWFYSVRIRTETKHNDGRVNNKKQVGCHIQEMDIDSNNEKACRLWREGTFFSGSSFISFKELRHNKVTEVDQGRILAIQTKIQNKDLFLLMNL